MTRIAIIPREEMNEEQGAVFDRAKASGGPTGGPFWAYVRNPALMQQCQDMSSCLRDSPLTSRERQIAILTVARFWGANYPWSVQVPNSLKAGVTQDIIDAINAGETPDLSDPRERAIHDVARELLATKGLSDATYAAAEAAFGADDLVSAVAQVGQFSMTCCTANAFDITPADGSPRLIR